MNPADLGYFEKSPGSGIWHHPQRRGCVFEPRTCPNPECPRNGEAFMGRRGKAQGQFCSAACSHRSLNPGYFGKHRRVRTARGPAKLQKCIDCGQAAREWSQRHETDGNDPRDYDPRCALCHHLYDGLDAVTGARNFHAKLTDAKARSIYTAIGLSNQELAKLYGIDPAQVSRIRAGKAWKHATSGRGEE